MQAEKERIMEDQIYIIYGDQDRKQAEFITGLVEKHGYRCFLRTRDMMPGASYPSVIQEKIGSAPMAIVVFGEHTSDSMMTVREVSYASDMGIPIITASLMEDVRITGGLYYYLSISHLIHIDLNGDNQQLIDEIDNYMSQIRGRNTANPSAKPDKPYDGTEPYIFISYSHKDMDKVFSIISRLQQEGYRVWYDEGIDPATEWDENIAQHIMDSGCLIAFISANYIASNNCKDEINFARDLDKPRLLVYIEQTKLPAGMAMRLMRIQAIHEYKYEDKSDFYSKLLSASVISSCS